MSKIRAFETEDTFNEAMTDVKSIIDIAAKLVGQCNDSNQAVSELDSVSLGEFLIIFSMISESIDAAKSAVDVTLSNIKNEIAKLNTTTE